MRAEMTDGLLNDWRILFNNDESYSSLDQLLTERGYGG